jgi:uncharacterized membrane protein
MSKVRVAGHSVHPMLVVFPLGLLATSVVWDLFFLGTGNRMWGQLAFYTILAGLVGGLLAAIPGFVDWLAIPRNTRAFGVGALHLGLNLLVVALFALSAILRGATRYDAPTIGVMIVGWVGVLVAVISGWLGGELVEQLGVGVNPHANLNAPSSLQRPGAHVEHPVPPYPTHPTPTVP